MNAKKHEEMRPMRRVRVSLIAIGIILMGPALMALAAGSLHYRDHRGLLVFAPFSFLIGLVMIIFAIRVGR